LSLPSPLCFTSGERIPLALSLSSPCNPVLIKLLAPTVNIQLIKRTTLWVKDSGGCPHEPYRSVREVLVNTAELRYIDDVGPSFSLLNYELKAGKCGGETSWKVQHKADVQYIIRATLRPPQMMAKHLPSFRCDHLIQLTTDHYGTLDTELLVMGGVPVPAVGLGSGHVIARSLSY
ncbi:hypothetical protein JAAARDRAFT_31573, partial [Jaapia argillacea MUCL 33604]